MALITINRTIVVQEQPDPVVTRPHRRRTVRRVVVASAALAVGGLAVTGALASPQPNLSVTNVTMIPLSVPHKVASVTIAANKTYSTQVSGANTTVPANATTVQLLVTAKGAVGGSLNFYPAGNPSGASGQTLTYPAGNVLASTTIQEKIGEASKLTISNASAGSAVVTATLNGYSTQVTYADVNGVGGNAGDLLVNTGSGAQWQAPPNTVPGPSNNGSPGDLLTRTASGTQWTTPNYALAPTNTTVIHSTGDLNADGAALRAALASGAKPFVEVDGGTYNLGSAPLEFANREVLIGAGPDATSILSTGNIGLNAGEISGVLLEFNGSAHLVADVGTSNLRNIEIDNDGTVPNVTAMGLEVGTGATVSLYNSVIEDVSRTATTPSVAILVNVNSIIFIRNSEITAFNNVAGPAASALNVFGFANVATSRVQADGAAATSAVVLTHNTGSNSVEINGSDVETVSTDVALDAINGSIRVGGSMIEGTAIHSGTGTTQCVDDYTRGYVARPTTC
jgi:hypothetical protein